MDDVTSGKPDKKNDSDKPKGFRVYEHSSLKKNSKGEILKEKKTVVRIPPCCHSSHSTAPPPMAATQPVQQVKEVVEKIVNRDVVVNKIPVWIWFIIAALVLAFFIQWCNNSDSELLALDETESDLSEDVTDENESVPDGEDERSADWNTRHSEGGTSEVAEVEELATATDEEDFGPYKPASGEVGVGVLVDLLEEAYNLRTLPDMLDGENKFLLLAAIKATDPLLSEEEWVKRAEDVYNATGQMSMVRVGMNASGARQYADWVNYVVVYHKPESFDSWANANVSKLPSSNETDYSRAVLRTLENIEEELENRGYTVEELLGRKRGGTLADKSDDNVRGTKITTRKKGKNLSSIVLADKGEYVSPLRPKDIKRYVRGVEPATSRDDAHHGHDLSANEGSTIRSTSDGKVIKKGYQVNKKGKGYGRYLAIYDGKYVWRYAHMKSRSVEQGDTVKRGQKIGTVGDTGAEGSFHLHVECWTPSEWNKKEAGKEATPISEQLWQ
ncbi:MAG: hypothetical protein QG654_160 [Patescibacteria group bacterium]|nr:hypothetical protein [Patescibacteria group bacterium]